MALPKMSEIRDLSDAEIQEAISECKKSLFDIRVKKAIRQLEKVHLIVHTKHKLAQLMTLAGERRLNRG